MKYHQDTANGGASANDRSLLFIGTLIFAVVWPMLHINSGAHQKRTSQNSRALGFNKTGSFAKAVMTWAGFQFNWLYS